jgi:Ca2+-transporting ATPase
MVADTEKESTPLQGAISRFSLKTSLALIALTLIVFFLGLYAGKPLLDMFLIAVAIAVAAVPEGLPVALTVILAIGVQRLDKKNGVVRKMLAAETLGNTSVILTDKTGTLTQAKMEMGQIRVFARGYKKEEILRLSLLNTDIVIENPRDHYAKLRVIGRPLEVALAKAAAKLGVMLPELKREVEILDYLPFTSKNKYSASLTKDGADYTFRINVFGAPEILIRNSDLPDTEKHSLIREVEKMAYDGERVLGLAVKEIKTNKEISLRERASFEKLKFIGTVSFRDPIRTGAKEAIEKVDKAGVRTIIITGDHRGTPECVAKELGMLVDRDQVIDGAELDAMSAEDLKRKLPILKIVARVSPEGKLRVAKAFKAIGEVVAMTGDGINDAASLKEADIGVAMGSGTDVAKDVSDLVLLDDNFATIVAAIEEGRRILENIRKVIVYLSTSIFTEMILIGGSILFGLALPINAIQILFVNFIADTFPAVALAFEDRVDSLLEKRRKMATNLFDKEMAFMTGLIGIPTSIFLFVIYVYLNSQDIDPNLVRTFIFAAFSSYSLFVIFPVRSLRKTVFRYSPFSNPFLIAGVLLGLASIAGAIYLPFMREILGTVALPMNWLVGVAAIGIFNLVAIELGKWLLRKWKLNGD